MCFSEHRVPQHPKCLSSFHHTSPIQQAIHGGSISPCETRSNSYDWFYIPLYHQWNSMSSKSVVLNSTLSDIPMGYPLITNITMENDRFQWVNQQQMAFFNGEVLVYQRSSPAHPLQAKSEIASSPTVRGFSSGEWEGPRMMLNAGENRPLSCGNIEILIILEITWPYMYIHVYKWYIHIHNSWLVQFGKKLGCFFRCLILPRPPSTPFCLRFGALPRW